MNDNLKAPEEPIFKEVVSHYAQILGYPIDEIVADTEPNHA